MILYIHGFASASNSKKVTLLQKRFNNVIALDLNPEPNIAMQQLEKYIQKHYQNTHITLIGSSLGGFYAMYLSDKYSLSTILINPAVEPWLTLDRYKNQEVINHITGHCFYFKMEYLQQLRKFQIINLDETKFLLLLQTGDKVLNYTKVLKSFPKIQNVVTEGGSHQFDYFQNYFDIISDFIKKHIK